MSRLLDWIRSTYRRIENPLLMKELRQTVRSRIYVYVFMGIIFTCLFIMSLFLLVKRGETRTMYGMGATSFVILYVAFYVVALVGIPMTAFLSQLYEVEQDCLELIQVTNLTTGQVIRGKIYAAGVKLLLFLTALIPFFAFSYLLRGISILSILAPLGFALLLSMLLVTVYLFFSMLVRGGFSKVMSILFVLGLSSLLMYFSYQYYNFVVMRGGTISTSGATFGLSRLSAYEILGVITMVLLIWGSLVFLFHQASLAMAMKSIRNHTWPVRYAFLILLMVFLVNPFVFYALGALNVPITQPFGTFALLQWPLFAILALVWVTEEDEIPRTVTEANHWYLSIPYLSRLTLPGGVWGYHFTVVCCLIIVCLAIAAYRIAQPISSGFMHRQSEWHFYSQLALSGYFLFYAGIAHYLARVMRTLWPRMMLRTVRGIVLVGIVVTMIGPLLVLGLTGSMSDVNSINVFTMFNPFFVLQEDHLNEPGSNWAAHVMAITAIGMVLWGTTFVTGRRILERSKLEI